MGSIFVLIALQFDLFSIRFILLLVFKKHKHLCFCCSKHMIEKAQLRITIQKKRNDSIIRQSRADIAQLLQIGQLDQAFARVSFLKKNILLCIVTLSFYFFLFILYFRIILLQFKKENYTLFFYFFSMNLYLG